MADEYVVKDLPFAYDSLKGLSKQLNTWHHDTHYAGYVKKRNEIAIKLKAADLTAANANYSEYGELKRRETFNACGQILHELYWDNLGGDGVPKGESVVKKIEGDFGSFDAWKRDAIAASKAALGWVVACYDLSDGKIHNYTCDTHNQGGVWGAMPLLAIDVFEHAYYADYGPDRAKYLDALLSNVDWKKVDARFGKLVKA